MVRPGTGHARRRRPVSIPAAAPIAPGAEPAASTAGSSGVPTVLLGADFGRIWLKRPWAAADGLVSVVQYPRKPPSPLATCTIRAAAFSHHADILATVDDRGNVFAFHIRRNRYALLAHGGGYSGTAVAFARRGTRNELFVAFADHLIRCIDPESGQVLATLRGHRASPRHLAASPSGEALLSAGPDGVLLWDTRNMERSRALGAGPYGLVQATFSADGTCVVAAFKDDSFWVWDAGTFALRKKLRAPLPRPGLLVACFALSPDGRYLTAAGAAGRLYVWDMGTDLLMHAVHLPQTVAAVRDVRYLPALGSAAVAVACDDGALLIVDVLASRLLARLAAPGARRLCDGFAVDARGQHAALISEEGDLRLYDLSMLYRGGATVAAGHGALAHTTPEQDGAAAAGEAMGGAGAAGAGGPAAGAGAWGGEDGPAMLALPSAVAAPPGGLAPRPGPGPAPARGPAPGRGPAAGARRSVAAAAASHASLASHELDMSRRRLKNLLDSYGEYPSKYRPMVWRFLLRLPGNAAAHAALADKGPHEAFDDLATRFPLQDRPLLGRLGRLLSALAHWSPVFAQAPWLPAAAFPFVKLLGADELLCFEAVASVLINYARGWLELFPHPPLRLLGSVEELLAHHDPGLHQALVARGLDLQPAAWAVLQAMLSEVLSKGEWLKAWDHLLSNDPGFFLFVILAYFVYFREPLAALPAQRDLEVFVRQAAALDLNKLLRLAYGLRQATPAGLQPDLPPLDVLPPGHAYPLFLGYPKVAVDFADKERARLRLEEEALARRRAVVTQLAARTEQLEASEARLAEEQGRLAALEAERQAVLDADADALRAERLRLDDADKEERLRQIAVVEETYRAALARQREAWLGELAKVRREAERKRTELAYEVRARLEDESIKSLEFRSQQRLWAMEEEAMHANALAAMRKEVEAADAAAGLEAQRRAAKWAAEDEEARLRAAHEAARRARLAQASEEGAARQELGSLLLQRGLEADLQLASVERERRLRAVAAAEARLAADAVEAARARETIAAAADRAALEATVLEDRAAYEAGGETRAGALDAERAAAAAEAAARAERLRALERGQRSRELEAAVADRRREYARLARAEEAETARVLDALEEERRKDREIELELEQKHLDLQARVEHAGALAGAQDAAGAAERARFDAARAARRDAALAAEAATRAAHEATLARLTLEREKQLLAMDAAWRQQTAEEETLGLQREALAMDTLRRQREAGYAAREAALLAQLQAEAAAERRLAGAGLGADIRARLWAEPYLAGTEYAGLGLAEPAAYPPPQQQQWEQQQQPQQQQQERQQRQQQQQQQQQQWEPAQQAPAPRAAAPAPYQPPAPAPPAPGGADRDGAVPARLSGARRAGPAGGDSVSHMLDAMAGLVGGYDGPPSARRPAPGGSSSSSGHGSTGGGTPTRPAAHASFTPHGPYDTSAVYGGGLDATLPSPQPAAASRSAAPPTGGSSGSEDSVEARLQRLEREASAFLGTHPR